MGGWVGGWVGRGDAPHFVLKPPRAGQAPKTTDFRPLTNYISFLGSHRSRGKHFRLLNRAEVRPHPEHRLGQTWPREGGGGGIKCQTISSLTGPWPREGAYRRLKHTFLGVALAPRGGVSKAKPYMLLDGALAPRRFGKMEDGR